ncbi:MarR family transcriptional regulator [Brachyspira pilosicoli]|uniref:MarR family transcriptional regulator n=1 Tax=Brachyspira pilosicoli TaxID=52584 RepID=UPI002868E9C0|nr:helix-turn-helix domain-containing protein [Brachyspira pilosicoli]
MVITVSIIGKKEIHNSKIFNCVSELKEATRGEIADRLKMEKSTVSARVNKMLQLGLLQEIGKEKIK